MTPVSLSSVMARPTVRNDARSAKSTLVKSGPILWDGTRVKSPLKRVSLGSPDSTHPAHADWIVVDGWANFSCSAESVSIWTKTDARGRDEFKKD